MFENPTVNLSALCSSCAKTPFGSSESIFLFLYVVGSIQNVSAEFVWCIHISSVDFPLHPDRTNKNVTELGREIQTALSVCHSLVHTKFFPPLTVTDNITS